MHRTLLRTGDPNTCQCLGSGSGTLSGLGKRWHCSGGIESPAGTVGCLPDPEFFTELEPFPEPDPERLPEPDPEAVRTDADWVPKKASQHDRRSLAPRKTISEDHFWH